MSYVLDGIKTALSVEDYERDGECWRRYHCPCGWSIGDGDYPDERHEEGLHQRALPALRFHYTHCPAAKPEPCAHVLPPQACEQRVRRERRRKA